MALTTAITAARLRPSSPEGRGPGGVLIVEGCADCGVEWRDTIDLDRVDHLEDIVFACGLAPGVIARGAWHELVGRRARVEVSKVCLRHEPGQRFVVTNWLPITKVLA